MALYSGNPFSTITPCSMNSLNPFSPITPCSMNFLNPFSPITPAVHSDNPFSPLLYTAQISQSLSYFLPNLLIPNFPQVKKKFFQMKTSTCRDGTLKNQPNKMGMTPQHIHIIPTSCAILTTMLCVC